MKSNEANVAIHQKCLDPKIFMLWYNCLGHPRSIMMHKIIENSQGHPLMNLKILSSSNYSCYACSQGKLIVKPSRTKIVLESPSFLERI